MHPIGAEKLIIATSLFPYPLRYILTISIAQNVTKENC
jgi:hypothetical protein